ncbi:MAG TPA: amino acid ABC transporter substrate-binding protein [Clostridiales bacterium]|nr:MAG: hypothetical protein A2Y18_04665 [Clostridiales bacterium GWD2_32_19]HCC07119.1 amino acid ABC transporter substrate-binding protein [Clostridiales bacterium]
MVNLNIQAKQFNFNGVDVLSDKQLGEHYKIYTNYVNKTNETMNALSTQADLGMPDHTYSKIRGLKVGEAYAFDAVKLHEYYFGNLNKQNSKCEGKIMDMINKEYGNYSTFEKRFKDVAQSVHGWAVLSYDKTLQKLHICGLDAHDKGVIVDSSPIMVVDVYEHAYFMDYGTDRASYINNVMMNVDWKVANDRLSKVVSAEVSFV